jgi:hypothetical protein
MDLTRTSEWQAAPEIPAEADTGLWHMQSEVGPVLILSGYRWRLQGRVSFRLYPTPAEKAQALSRVRAIADDLGVPLFVLESDLRRALPYRWVQA